MPQRTINEQVLVAFNGMVIAFGGEGALRAVYLFTDDLAWCDTIWHAYVASYVHDHEQQWNAMNSWDSFIRTV